MRRPALLGVALCLLALTVLTVRADTVVFKDGFVLRGKVVPAERRTIVDPYGGQDVEVKTGFMVDDGPRRIIFSPGPESAPYAAHVDDKPFNKDEDAYRWSNYVDPAGALRVPSIHEILNPGTWDSEGKRTFEYESPKGGRITVYQRIGLVSPYYARVDSRPPPRPNLPKYNFSAYYLTRELGPDMVRDLLATNKLLGEGRDVKPEDRPKRRFQMIEFLVRAGWLDTADYELDRLYKDYPREKEGVETARANLKKLQLLQLAGSLEKAATAGRHEWVRKQLAEFPNDAPEAALAIVRPLRDRYEKSTEQLKQARRFLQELPLDVGIPAQGRLFTEAAAAILADLNHDNVGRLESFVQQAAQAERLRKQKKKPDLTSAEILARAVSGWLLGDASAESDVEVARRLWQARQLVLKYQTTNDAGDRARLLADYEKVKSDVLPMDVLAQVIGVLPPAEAEEKIPTKVVERKVGGGKYHLQLPPEYSHGRAYPVLIVAPPGSDKARETLERWGGAAAENGYILAVPEWGRGPAAVYGYTTDEQVPVLETLRDLRRHFQVDSDRVFLAGQGSGADMAYDVGLAHPDLFAAVLPTSGVPGPYVHHYRENAQFLPFYVVSGDRSGESYKENYNLFKDWMMAIFPVYYVQYKGRGLETFDGEVANSFDWMKYKRRAYPLEGIGRTENGFASVRAADNRFYWLSTDALDARHQNESGTWTNRVSPAAIQAVNFYWRNKENQINVKVNGVRQVSIWLGRNAKGESLIDFSKGLTVYINSTKRLTNTVIQPSLAVLLEDLYDRGDRQRLYLARLDFKPER
jgi:hypothetical protein